MTHLGASDPIVRAKLSVTKEHPYNLGQSPVVGIVVLLPMEAAMAELKLDVLRV
jgi:hypothetical protein